MIVSIENCAKANPSLAELYTLYFSKLTKLASQQRMYKRSCKRCMSSLPFRHHLDPGSRAAFLWGPMRHAFLSQTRLRCRLAAFSVLRTDACSTIRKKENRVSFCLNCSKNRRCEMNNRGLLEISISTQLVQAVIFWCSAAKGMHPSYPLPHPVGPQGKLKMNFACSDPWAKLTIPFAVIEPRLQRRKLCYTTLKLFVK